MLEEESGRDAAPPGYRPLVVVRRGGIVESVHHGAVAVADDGGRTVLAHGDPGAVTFLRSAAKPAQILPLLVSGAAERFGLTEPEIAVMIGSHGGEPFQIEAVRSILAKIGLGEEALRCGAHIPYDRAVARALREAGRGPSVLHNNCSGKHAGMLALSVFLGAPTGTYLDPDHPVQVLILDALSSLAGRPASGIPQAVDGCSAPTFALPLATAAAIYARLVSPARLPGPLAEAARRSVAAMRSRPDMVAGTDRICTALMREGEGGLIAKIGAEGFYGLGFVRDGRGFGIALKVADGDGERARSAAVIETLRQIRLISEGKAGDLFGRFVGELRNHRGLPVARVEPAFELRPVA
jgi:L-asparaginase II